MIKRLPWLRGRKKTDPEVPLRLPIACGPVSNGEGWWPDSARKRLIRKLVNEKAEEVSRREGIDRREFMASACGMATTLYMINLVNGCADRHAANNMLGTGGRDGSDGMKASGGKGGGGSDTTWGGTGGGGGRDAGHAVGGKGGGGTGGYPGITDATMHDPDAARCALGDGGNELIVDMQTHFSSVGPSALPDADWQKFIGSITSERYPWLTRAPGCEGSGACLDDRAYVEEIFMNSDTTISALSGIPYAIGADGTGVSGPAVLTNEDVLAAAMKIEGAFPNRMLTQCIVMPNDRLDVQLATMEWNRSSYDNWNASTAWSPNGDGGYWLDQDVGPQMIQKGLDLGKPIFCVHKGFPINGSNSAYSSPRDVGPAALMFPDAHFVVLHSAFEQGLAPGDSTLPSRDDPTQDVGWGPGVGQWPEGPYDESLEALGDMQPTTKGTFPLDRGVNSLIKSLRDAGIGPNGTSLDGKGRPVTRVYAECGAAWPNLMLGRVEEAMHYWGKLLKHVGEDRIVWGTDCLWFGCPQPLIQAFRAFEISQEFQEKYGYPALSPRRKEKILGWNAAAMQRFVTNKIEPYVDCRLEGEGSNLFRRKRDLDEAFGVRRDMIRNVPGPRTRREFLRLRAAGHRQKLALAGRVPARRRA